MKSIQKLRIEDSMTGLFINVMAFNEAIAGKRNSTGSCKRKATPALDKAYSMKQKSPNCIFNSDHPKHNSATVLSAEPKGLGFTKAIERSSEMLTNTVCRY